MPGYTDQLVALMTPNTGVLVLAGCQSLGGEVKNNEVKQDILKGWQDYATSRKVTIIGSVGYCYPTKLNTYRGIWVTLVPGGTAPTLTYDPPPPPQP